VVLRRGVFGVRWVVGGGRDEGLYEGGDGGVDVRDGSAELGVHAGAFVGEEEGGGGGCEGVFECWLRATPFPPTPFFSSMIFTISSIRSTRRCHSLNVHDRSARSVYALSTTWNKCRSGLAVTT